jgi:hypothetical protein
VMVEGAFTDAEPLTEPIDAQAVGPVMGDDFEAGLKPIRLSRHGKTIPYGMVWI